MRLISETLLGMEARYNCCKAIHLAFSASDKFLNDPSLAGVAVKLHEAVRRGPYLGREKIEAQPLVVTADRVQKLASHFYVPYWESVWSVSDMSSIQYSYPSSKLSQTSKIARGNFLWVWFGREPTLLREQGFCLMLQIPRKMRFIYSRLKITEHNSPGT
ncbi:hypothetical protein GIB67_039211 [Kingdonia uniflora]|uniref:Uncharacterized protein n=1 Tax=Kingdonia uniflora TaxID=39325 RepID=A0A7J7MM66_9MAGN|nr:hypothetical protein GIB67_039211 [Kingdonia uniflora]